MKENENKPQINMRIPGVRGSRSFGMSEKPKDAKATVKRLLEYFAADVRLVLFLICAVALSVLCTVAAPSLQSTAIDIITEEKYDALTGILLCMLILYVGYSLTNLIQNLLSAKLSQSIAMKIRGDLFGKIVHLPIKYTDTHPHGDLMSRMTNDAENISNTVSQSLGSLVSGVLTVIGTVAIMIYYCLPLALLSCSTVLLTVIVTKNLSRIMRKFFLKRQTLLGEINAIAEEKITGFRTVTAYNRQNEAIKEFCANSDALTKTGIAAEIFSGSMGPLMNVVNNVGFVIIAAFGGYFAFKGIISIGVVSAFIVYAKQFGRPINEIANVYGQIQSAAAGAERIFAVMDEEEEDRSGNLEMDENVKNISFRKVNFSYEEDKQILFDFDLDICSGQKIALVGATGSGKTTVVNLLMRFYDVDSGSILINGKDIKDISLDDLRKNVAIVLQDTVLFSDTIKNNLKYADPDADDERVERASKLSKCFDMIRHLPKKYETLLSASGQNLSQGQRQLLSIGRALLADAQILILDEATSGVDTRTEKNIQNAMANLMKNRTSLIIAHRLSTIRDADVIIVMDKGRIKEKGSHDELIERKGKYYELYMTQFAGNAT